MVALLDTSLLPSKTALRARGATSHSQPRRATALKSRYRIEIRHFTYDARRRLGLCSNDPIGALGGLNNYCYVSGSPISSVDPLGFDRLVPADATKALAFKLMSHYYNGNNLPYRDFAIGLKVDISIAADAADQLRKIALAACTQRVCPRCQSDSGTRNKKLKTQPASYWLLHTTNVPSDGFYLDIEWTADSNGTCCDCCTVDFFVDYQWRDWADLHPETYLFPDLLASWIPADGPYWIDIRWSDNATFKMPCRVGGCESEESGWPFEIPEYLVKPISVPRGPIGGPQ